MHKFIAACAALSVIGAAAAADEITDTLQSALQAYEAGDLQFTMEEIAYAQQLVYDQRLAALNALLPAVPDGWQIVQNNPGAGLSANAVYRSGNNQVSVQYAFDSPMIQQINSIFANSASLGSQGKLVRVGRQKFLERSNQMSGVIAGRILIQASGNDMDIMKALLESVDFSALRDLVQ